MKKIILWILVVFSVSNISYAEEESIELYAQSAVLMDGENGRILFEKDGENAMANASTTKILTCILALENGDLRSTVEVSKRAQQQPAVHLKAKEGEQYYLEDILYALMLESFNDCAVMVAEEISGSVEDFAQLMNEKAKEIGCEDTYFITPNGLDDVDEFSFHHTTASDLALIMRYCITESPQKEAFLDITQTPDHTFTTIDGERSFYCTNYNSLLKMMEEALTGKTGFTNDAGYCYVGAIESEGRTFIVALLASGWPSNRSYRWKDAEKLLNYGMEHYRYREIESVSDIDNIVVENGEEETTTLDCYVNEGGPISTESLEKSVKILMREDEEIEVKYDYPNKLYSYMEKDTLVGSVRYLLDGKLYKIDGIKLGEDYEESNISIWEKLIKFFTRG